MKSLSTLRLALVLALSSHSAIAGQVEADFNDLYAGDTRTRTLESSRNDNNLNTGTGFTPATASFDGGNGEYNNNTGVVQFEKGDLPVPAGVTGFVSVQSTPVDATSPGGISFGSSYETGNPNNKYRRFQERTLTPTLTGSEIWFSFLFRLDGPLADGRVHFNKPSTTDSSQTNPSAFTISLGNAEHPGRIAIDVTGDTAQNPPAVITPGAYHDGVDVINPANITSHLIIGRIIVNPSGNEVIEVWLDPATTANLETSTPTLTATDEIGANGITSIAFEGTRHAAPAPSNGSPYASGGHSLIDHFRMSDEANAFEFVTGNVVVDPKLIISPSSAATSFNFRGVYGASTPVTSTPLTVTLKNDGINEDIRINSVSFLNATSVFTIVNGPITNVDLLPGQTLDITVQASSSTLEALQSNVLIVDTDEEGQDLNIGVGATFYTGGSRVNPNPHFESTMDGWTNDAYSQNTPPLRVTPGLIGTGGMVRLRGVGDPAGGAPDNLSQTFLNGASDWEFVFAFSPINSSNFAGYTGSEPIDADRTFQVVIQSDADIPTPAAGTEGRFTHLNNANAALINLAYLPADGRGFSVFNGSTWESVGLPLIAGSTDANNDGSLTPGGTDVINYYVVRIKGTGFGTSSARYSISVSHPNSSQTAAIVGDLATWSYSSGQSETPAAYTFTTGDISSSGSMNEQTSLATSFWIDEVAFYSSFARDPAITAGIGPVIISHNGTTTSGSLPVTNTGFSSNLELSSLAFSNPAIFSSPATLPVVIPPGTTAHVPVNINPSGFTGTNNSGTSNVTIGSNVSLQPSITTSIVGAGTTDANFLPNWNFETPGTDQAADYDTFAFWDEFVGTTGSKDVPGLVAGSAKAVHIAGGSAIRDTFGAPAGNFVAETYFAVRDTTLRAFNINLYGATGTTGPVLNLRYEASKWEAYSTVWNTLIDMTSSPLVPSVDANSNLSLDDPGDTKSVYKLRITGTGWDTATPTYQIEILDLGGNVVASSDPGIAFYQYGVPSGGALIYSFVASAGGTTTNAGFWADDVLISTVSAGSGVVITSLSGGPGNFTLNWDSGGSPAIVERSYTLLPDSWQIISEAGGDPDGTFTDSSLPPDGKAFYRVTKN